MSQTCETSLKTAKGVQGGASEFLVLSASPHVSSPDSTRGIMRDVLLALLPAGIAAVCFFGLKALELIAVTVLSCVAAEAFWQKALKRPVTVSDLSAVVTGVLLAFNVPVSAPLWLPAVGGVFAIIVVKQCFGGLGENVVNPALAARAALLAAWPVHMAAWTLDGMSTATPLSVLKYGGELPSFMNVFVGHIGGCLGETSTLAILLGAAWLLWRKVITWHIPVVYIVTVGVLTFVLGRHGAFTGCPFYEVCSGGLMLGAFFMATDYATTPMTVRGQMIFALGCGVLCTLIRLYGGYAEGVSYSILIMNLFVPMIDMAVRPRIFGEAK